MEETVMGVFKLGKLNKAMLKVLMEPYRGTDIDSGGAADLKTKDGLEVPDLVIKIMDPHHIQEARTAPSRRQETPQGL